jgi:GNAT superfamily N-acetyltransferase
VRPTLAELAEDTAVHLSPRPGFDMVDRGEYVFEAGSARAAVHRVRLGDVDAAVGWTRAECARRGIERLEWWLGWHATPGGLAGELAACGFVPDETPVLTGMTCVAEPPAPSDVDVRPVHTLEEQLEVLEVDWEVWELTADERASRRAWERERFDEIEAAGTVHHYAARVDGRPVGFGRAIDMDRGVALMGGAVLPAFRGRGVYRALVRARWDHAAARGTPLLVVQAGAMSAPVLDGLGFVRHGDLRLFVDPGVASGHGDN